MGVEYSSLADVSKSKQRLSMHIYFKAWCYIMVL